MHGDDAAGLEFEFGAADAVVGEEDFLGAALQDVEAAGFVPLGGGDDAAFGAASLRDAHGIEEFDGQV